MKTLFALNPHDRSNGKGVALAVEQGTYVEHSDDGTVKVIECELASTERTRHGNDPRFKFVADDDAITQSVRDTTRSDIADWIRAQQSDLSGPEVGETAREWAQRQGKGRQ